LEYEYQRYRHATVEYMVGRLIACYIPIVRPPGGHAVFIDAAAFCPHLKPCDYPGIGLVNTLYLEGGIRGVELGSVMFGRPLPGGKDEIPASREFSPARVSAPRLYPKSFRLRHRSAGSRLAAARCDPTLQDYKTGAVFAPRRKSTARSHR
jgi:tryptophanase